jgi:hypothetical protein
MTCLHLRPPAHLPCRHTGRGLHPISSVVFCLSWTKAAWATRLAPVPHPWSDGSSFGSPARPDHETFLPPERLCSAYPAAKPAALMSSGQASLTTNGWSLKACGTAKSCLCPFVAFAPFAYEKRFSDKGLHQKFENHRQAPHAGRLFRKAREYGLGDVVDFDDLLSRPTHHLGYS